MQPLPEQLHGCQVFPIQPGTKDPATTHGWKECSNDPAQIERWQRVNPNFNWGVATGPSGLFVFDVDPAGLDWWAKLLERDTQIREAVGRAFQVRTPKGGLHVYFKGEGPSTASRIAEGIDTRGGFMRQGKMVSGGYVVLPGSHTVEGPGRVNGSYEALPGGTISPMPDFMRAIVPERKKTDTLGLTKNPDKDLPRNIKTANDLIENYVTSGRVAREGAGGDNLTFQVVASILDKGISPGLCFDLLWEKWNPHCQPPWDDWELETKIKNALAHGEDTDSGVKGHQSNADAFAAFEGMQADLAVTEGKRSTRDKLKFIHEFADSSGDPEWLLPGVLPTIGTGMLVGESGSYKSFVALDLGLTLAFGIPGQWGNVNEKTDVLFFAGESPIGMAKLRFPSWMEAHGLEFRSDHRMIFKDRVPFYSDLDEWENIRIDLEELKAKPRLIVIDTYSRLLTGMDENSAKDTTTATTFLEALSRYYECFVLVIHHTGKDQSKGARGSSALFSNVDVSMSLRKTNEGTELKIRKQKEADVDDATFYFKKEVFGKSIVLTRTENRSPEVDKKAKPVADWASIKEIQAVLVDKCAGEAGLQILAQEIHLITQVDKAKIISVLSNSDELKIFKQGSKWVQLGGMPADQDEPTTEFDL